VEGSGCEPQIQDVGERERGDDLDLQFVREGGKELIERKTKESTVSFGGQSGRCLQSWIAYLRRAAVVE
jgi:hypothetical protein